MPPAPVQAAYSSQSKTALYACVDWKSGTRPVRRRPARNHRGRDAGTSGAGMFIGFAPEGARMAGVELDPLRPSNSPGPVPDAAIHSGFFADTPIKTNSFDLAVGTVPFSKNTPYDTRTRAAAQARAGPGACQHGLENFLERWCSSSLQGGF